MKTERDYAAAAEWADDAMELNPDSATSKSGAQAAAAGRTALETAFGSPAALTRALGGGPGG